MQSQTVQNQIRELESIKRKTRLLRLGATLGSLVFVLGCVAVMNTAIRNLFQPGPTQEQFVQQVTDGLNRDVVPNIQQLAVQTVTESRPIVEQEFTKLNAEVPRIAEASMTEFNTLQKELPTRAEKVLDDTFGQMLKGRESKIREMFPEATDEKIETLFNNLTDEGTTRLSNINHKLFDPHIRTMVAISGNMEKIQQQEAPAIKGEVPTWQMGLLLFDIARADFKDLEMPGFKPTSASGGAMSGAKPANGAAKPAAAKPAAAKPATSGATQGY